MSKMEPYLVFQRNKSKTCHLAHRRGPFTIAVTLEPFSLTQHIPGAGGGGTNTRGITQVGRLLFWAKGSLSLNNKT